MALYSSAHEFLKAVEDRYRRLPGYSDSGLSRSFSQRRPRICTFETAYSADGRFRFAFATPHPYRRLAHRVARYVIGTDSSKPYFYSQYYDGRAELDHPESLDMMLAGATGISSGTAHTIGALLFDGISGWNLRDMRRIRFRPRRKADSVECIVVSGLHPWRGGRITAWFGAEDLLLRRLVRHRMKSEELRFDVKPSFSGPESHFNEPRFDV